MGYRKGTFKKMSKTQERPESNRERVVRKAKTRATIYQLNQYTP